ncbi:MAG TPA: hypothetical protein VFY65_02065 [Longimicrobium sp.]|nr:hypothetical protein [Longimicrobium sp.]
MKSIRFAAILVAALGWAVPARAQAADTVAITTALWTACPGANVRLTVRSGEAVTGRCGEMGDGRLLLRAEDGERRIALIDVDSLWVQRSLQTEAAVVLAVLGGIAGGFYANSRDPGDCFAYGCNGERLVATLRGAAIGTVGGAALGVIVGPRLTRWRLRVP